MHKEQEVSKLLAMHKHLKKQYEKKLTKGNLHKLLYNMKLQI